MKETLLLKLIEKLLDSADDSSGSKQTGNLHKRHIGKYVIVRSKSEGVNAGVLVDADGTGCVLSECRRLWSHTPKSGASWYEGVSIQGLSDDSKISVTVEEKSIIEDYSVTICTDVAEESIRGSKSYEA